MAMPWSLAEEALLKECVQNSVPRKEIPAYFPERAPSAIERKFIRMFPGIIQWGKSQRAEKAKAKGDRELQDPAVINRRQDLRFQAAMLRAIRRKKESAPIGIYRAPDAETWAPRHFPRFGQLHSYCSSPAAECASLAS